MALANTAGAEDVAGASSILASNFARSRGANGAALAQQAAYEVPSAARSLPSLNLSALADDIVAQLKLQVITGMDAWNAVLQWVPKPLHATLGRLIEVQLDWPLREAMRKMREAQLRLETLEQEKARGPVMPKAPFFTLGIAYDFYASLVAQYGSKPARATLYKDGMLVVALRNQSSTLANHGLGSYDDQIVVLNGVGRLGVARVFAACTEPGAQYSHRAQLDHLGKRPDARYASVKLRHADGEDVNGDGVKDAGRLMAGTYRYFWREKLFHNNRVFEVKTTQVVERDTDGDGRFTSDDPDRIDKRRAGTTMYIHPGGSNDTSGAGTGSAGCQTVPMPLWTQFLATMGKVDQGFYYVLINAAVT